MSLYRKTLRDNVLITEKRKWLRWWRWMPNRSDEDHLTRMKNRLVLLNAELSMLRRQIPQEEDRLKKIKDGLALTGGTGTPRRDSWRPRMEPVRLKENISIGRKKKDRCKPQQPVELARIVTGPKGG